MESLTAQCGTGLSREVDENRVHNSLSLVHTLDVKKVGGWLLGESFGKVLLVYREFHLTLRKAVSSPQLMREWFQGSHIKYSTFPPCNLGAQWISVYLSCGKTWSVNKRVVSFSDGRTEAEWQFWVACIPRVCRGKRGGKKKALHIGYTRVSCVQRSPCQSFQISPERAVWRGKYNSAESSCRYTEMLKGRGRTKCPPGWERHICPSQGNRCPATAEGLGKKQISKETIDISPVRNSKSLNTCHVWRIPVKITTTGWAQ